MTANMSARAIQAREASRQRTGEFGKQQHSEPEGKLKPSPLAAATFTHDDERVDLWDDKRVLQLNERQLAEIVQRRVREMTRRHVRRTGVDESRVDDIAQQSVVEMLERLAKKRRETDTTTDAGMYRSIIEHGGLLNQCINSVTQWERFDPKQIRHEEVNAYRQLQEAEQEFEQANHRPMTAKERDAEAERIRVQEFPAGRRPRIGYQRVHFTTVSLDAPVGRDGDDGLQLSDVAADDVDYGTVGRIGDDRDNPVLQRVTQREHDAYDKVAGDRPVSTAAQPRAKYGLSEDRAWSVWAEGTGLPPVARPLNAEQSARVKDAVSNYPGGAAGMARDYRNGDIDERTAAPLFAPFGRLSAREEDELCVSFAHYDHAAERLWAAAVSEAGRLR
ncbi:MAG: hypothetical protein ACTH0V_00195 [Microbacteriaceae bacterium]